MKKVRQSHPSERVLTSQALNGIMKIVPFFHRIKLSSKLLYKDIDNIFPGSIKQPGNSGDIALNKTGKKYQKMAWLWLPSRDGSARQRIAINYNPIDAFCPKSQFNIINPTVETLAYLDMKTTKN